MNFSMNAAWEDTVRLLRANASLFLAVAGVFLFLPAVIAGYVAPEPKGGAEGVTVAMTMGYVRENLPLLFLVQLVGLVGNLALLILALDQERPTVGGAISGAFRLLPAYFLASVVSGFIIFLGILALILPGLYLIGRLAVVGAVIVAEGRRNPIDVVRRSFAVTRGKGWAILAMILVVVMVFAVVNLAAVTVFGSIFLLLDRATDAGIGTFLILILEAAIGAIFNAVLIVLLASLYRRLTVSAV